MASFDQMIQECIHEITVLLEDDLGPAEMATGLGIVKSILADILSQMGSQFYDPEDDD